MTIADVWTAIYPWIVAGLGGFVGAALKPLESLRYHSENTSPLRSAATISPA
jgi:hypothetical protein